MFHICRVLAMALTRAYQQMLIPALAGENETVQEVSFNNRLLCVEEECHVSCINLCLRELISIKFTIISFFCWPKAKF